MKDLHYILAAAVVFLAACVRHSESGAAMDRADAVMEERPDSALTLLQGIDVSGLDGEEERARYALLMSMALMKEGYAVEDTAFIAGSLRHYQKGGDTPDHMKSLYLTADVLHNAGEYGGAMSMLLKAYDIAVKTGDLYWQAKTSELMGDVSSSAYNNSDLAEYSMRAADLYGKAGRDNNRRYVLVDHAIALANLGRVDEALSIVDSIYNLGAAQPADSALMLYSARAKLSVLLENGRVEDALGVIADVPEHKLGLIITGARYALLAQYFINRNDWIQATDFLAKAANLQRTVADSVGLLAAYADYYSGRNDMQSAKLYTDSVLAMQNRELIHLLKYSTLVSQRDFIQKKELEANRKALYTSIISAATIVFLIILAAAIFCIYRLRIKAEKASRQEKLRELKLMTDRFEKESVRGRLLEKSIASLKSHLEDKEIEIAQKNLEISSMAADITDNTAKTKNLTQQLETLKKEIDRLTAERDAIAALEASVEKKLSEVQVQLAKSSDELSLMRRERDSRERALHAEMTELYKGTWSTLNQLCRMQCQQSTSVKENKTLVKEIEKEISVLRSEKAIREIEKRINKYSDGIVDRLRTQCPFIKSDDLMFIILLMAGFSSHGICIILDISQDNYYKKRKRLITKLLSSNAPDKQEFVTAMS